MLLALVFRGVAFEFRWRSEKRRYLWDFAFIGGSTLAAFCQGVALGAILQGVEVEGRAYAGTWWDWLSPFTVLTGLSVVAGYALLGATWLNMKLAGEPQEKARKIAWVCGVATVGCIVAVSLATPFLGNAYWERWFALPQLLFAAPVPILVALLTLALFRSLMRHNQDIAPFVIALAIFFITFVGLGISMWPYVIPMEVTIYDAASPFKSQLFMFVGAVVMLPIILGYTAYSYWVFRGKVDPDKGYH